MKRVACILLCVLIVVLQIIPVSAVNGALLESKNRQTYISEVLPEYLLLEPQRTYSRISLSQGFSVCGHNDVNARTYFVFDENTQIGVLNVTNSAGKYYSTFYFESDPTVTSAFQLGQEIVLTNDNEHLNIVAKTNTASDIMAITRDYPYEKIVLIDMGIDVTQIMDETNDSIRAGNVVSLGVSRVPNYTLIENGNQRGLCWTASIAAISNHRNGTNYSALSLYNQICAENPGYTPVGDTNWILVGFESCDISATFTGGLYRSDVWSIMNNYRKPIFVDVYNDALDKAHDIVMTQVSVGSQSVSYGFVDPNVAGIVYVYFSDTICDPDDFEYSNGQYTYDIWRKSFY